MPIALSKAGPVSIKPIKSEDLRDIARLIETGHFKLCGDNPICWVEPADAESYDLVFGHELNHDAYDCGIYADHMGFVAYVIVNIPGDRDTPPDSDVKEVGPYRRSLTDAMVDLILAGVKDELQNVLSFDPDFSFDPGDWA